MSFEEITDCVCEDVYPRVSERLLSHIQYDFRDIIDISTRNGDCIILFFMYKKHHTLIGISDFEYHTDKVRNG